MAPSDMHLVPSWDDPYGDDDRHDWDGTPIHWPRIDRFDFADPGPFGEPPIETFDDAVAWVRSWPRRHIGYTVDLHLDVDRRPACVRHSYFIPEFGTDTISSALTSLQLCRHVHVVLLDVRRGGSNATPTQRELRAWPHVVAAYERVGVRLLDLVITTPKKATSLGRAWVDEGGTPTLGPWRWS